MPSLTTNNRNLTQKVSTYDACIPAKIFDQTQSHKHTTVQILTQHTCVLTLIIFTVSSVRAVCNYIVNEDHSIYAKYQLYILYDYVYYIFYIFLFYGFSTLYLLSKDQQHIKAQLMTNHDRNMNTSMSSLICHFFKINIGIAVSFYVMTNSVILYYLIVKDHESDTSNNWVTHYLIESWICDADIYCVLYKAFFLMLKIVFSFVTPILHCLVFLSILYVYKNYIAKRIGYTADLDGKITTQQVDLQQNKLQQVENSSDSSLDCHMENISVIWDTKQIEDKENGDNPNVIITPPTTKQLKWIKLKTFSNSKANYLPVNNLSPRPLLSPKSAMNASNTCTDEKDWDHLTVELYCRMFQWFLLFFVVWMILNMFLYSMDSIYYSRIAKYWDYWYCMSFIYLYCVSIM